MINLRALNMRYKDLGGEWSSLKKKLKAKGSSRKMSKGFSKKKERSIIISIRSSMILRQRVSISFKKKKGVVWRLRLNQQKPKD